MRMATPPRELADTLRKLDQLDAELAAMRAELDRADPLITLGGISAGVAHELNNLLTPALGYAQAAERSPERTDLTAKALRRTIEAIQASAAILETTLDLASVAGPLDSDSNGPSTCEAGAALDQALRAIGRSPEADGITLERVGEQSLHAAIDGRLLAQVFVNLLTNATRVLRRQRGGRIRVEITLDPAGDVAIRVGDSGPGLPETLRTQVFDAFVSSETPEQGRPAEGGRGLGLAICRRTVERAHGSIAAGTSDLGGAEFRITLPAATASEGEQRRAA